MKTLQESIDDFLAYCKFERGLTKLSLKAYRLDLDQFHKVFREVSTVPDITKDIVKQYVQYLFDAGLKETSIKRKLACLKSFLRYLEYEDQIIVSPFRKLNITIRVPRNIPRYLRMDEVQGLFSVVNKVHDKRKNVSITSIELLQRTIIIEILFSTGIRVSELCSLDLDDIDIARGTIRVHGKGARERSVFITHPHTIGLLREYVERRAKANSSRSLFLNRVLTRMQPHSVREILAKIAMSAKLKRVTPHMFRHTIATMLIENGVDIRFVQRFLGHSSILTTQKYTHISTFAERTFIADRHPRNQL